MIPGVAANAVLNIREDPTERSRIIRYDPSRHEGRRGLLGRLQDKWIFVRYDDAEGWVDSRFVRPVTRRGQRLDATSDRQRGARRQDLALKTDQARRPALHQRRGSTAQQYLARWRYEVQMIKIILVATAALAVGAIAALAIAASTSPETHAGGSAPERSVQNGHDAITGKFIWRTMFFRRGTDCPEDDQGRDPPRGWRTRDQIRRQVRLALRGAIAAGADDALLA